MSHGGSRSDGRLWLPIARGRPLVSRSSTPPLTCALGQTTRPGASAELKHGSNRKLPTKHRHASLRLIASDPVKQCPDFERVWSVGVPLGLNAWKIVAVVVVAPTADAGAAITAAAT